MADTELVSQSFPTDGSGTSICQSEQRYSKTTKPSTGDSPNLGQNEPNNLPLVRKSLDQFDLSSDAKDIIMASWRPGTSKQYQTYLNKWFVFCMKHNFDVFKPGVEHAIEFLVNLYHSGIGYSAINTARSALSTILTLEREVKFGEHPLVTRYMKGIFECRPALPRYSDIWDVNVVLNYLKTLERVDLIPLITLKLTMLLCLTTGQRGQTIHNYYSATSNPLSQPRKPRLHVGSN